ncbi:MAG: polysaccharide biosynthesis/export family protein [Novosphingobium sp.]
MGDRLQETAGTSHVGEALWSAWLVAARLVFVVALALILAGCNSRGGKIPYDPAGFGAPDRAELGTEAYDVPLGPLDVIRVSVFRVPDLSADYQVDAFGNLDLPLVGKFSVRDQGPDQLATLLEQKYGAKYLQNPEITVRVINTNRTSVTVEGGVNVPGIYALPGRTSLLGALALARGINVNEANPKRVAIFRKRDGKTQAAAFDVTSIRHGDMADPIVYPGDTIVVDSSGLRSLYRELIQAVPLIAVFRNL